jgi:hypothetical protein
MDAIREVLPSTWPQHIWNASMIYPLQTYFFAGLNVPGPSIKIAQHRYKFDKCVLPSWNHRLEKFQNKCTGDFPISLPTEVKSICSVKHAVKWGLHVSATEVDCCMLAEYFPFSASYLHMQNNSSRSRSGNGGSGNGGRNGSGGRNMHRLESILHTKQLVHRSTIFFNAPVLVRVYVLSTPGKESDRNVIRNTWGSYPGNWSLTFLLGRAEATDASEIQMENNTYGDIVVVDVIESFDSITAKSAAILAYHDTAKFHFKTDSDSYVNIPSLLEMLSNRMRGVSIPTNPASQVYGGHIFAGVFPQRSGKYYMPREVYPNETYPPFAVGSGYFMSQSLMKCAHAHLHNATLSPSEFRLEDVYIGWLCSTYCSPIYINVKTAFWGMMSISQTHRAVNQVVPKYVIMVHKVNTLLMGQLHNTMKEKYYSHILS